MVLARLKAGAMFVAQPIFHDPRSADLQPLFPDPEDANGSVSTFESSLVSASCAEPHNTAHLFNTKLHARCTRSAHCVRAEHMHNPLCENVGA